jgi:DNA-directed RNA polymerase specialized sigma24 family protein
MLRRTAPSRRLIGRVLGAAVAAAADRESAERATVRAFAEAAGGVCDADELAARAVRLALREAPAVPFCAMTSEDAEAIALARLLQLPEGRIAALLDIDRRELRRRFARGLRACLPEPACA